MNMALIIDKYKYLWLFLIVLCGFFLRFSAAASLHISEDEMMDMVTVDLISFDLNDLRLPVVDPLQESCGMVFKYFLRIGWDLFGHTLLGARLPFVIISCLFAIFLYMVIKRIYGPGYGVLAALFYSINPYSVINGGIADLTVLLPIIYIMSAFLFFKAMQSERIFLFLLNGVFIGIAVWFKENMVLLIPMYVLFLLITPQYRYLLKKKSLWIGFILSGVVVIPMFLFSMSVESPRYEYIQNAADFGLSLSFISLYAGELIPFLLQGLPPVFDEVATMLAAEYPMVDIVLGLLILYAAFYHLKTKNSFTRLLTVCFFCEGLLFTFIRRYNPDLIYGFSSISGDWPQTTFLGGLILAVLFIGKVVEKNNVRGGLFIVLMSLYLFFRSSIIVDDYLYCYWPLEEYCLKEEVACVEEFYKNEYKRKMYYGKDRQRHINEILEAVILRAPADSPSRKKAELLLNRIKESKDV